MNNQFKKIKTSLNDVFILERFVHKDTRGSLTKTYNISMFEELDIGKDLKIKESLCSVSKKNVIRGMHFQQYPHGCAKIVSVVKGAILDVVVGVNNGLNTSNLGKFFSVELSATNKKCLYIPNGYAHGYLVLSEEAVIVYHQTKLFDSNSDTGVRYDSFGFNWPVSNPILSEKDQNLVGLKDLIL